MLTNAHTGLVTITATQENTKISPVMTIHTPVLVWYRPGSVVALPGYIFLLVSREGIEPSTL